ncbi:MAG: SGNH/GDSL hydrolase family protein [Candidatus Dormibacteraceae bacterium]
MRTRSRAGGGLAATVLGAVLLLTGATPAAASVADGSLSLLFVGASITDGFLTPSGDQAYTSQLIAMMQGRGYIVEPHVDAAPGAIAADTRRWPINGPLDIAVVQIGTNDFHRTPINSFRSSYSSLLARIRGAGPWASAVCLSTWMDPHRRNGRGLRAGAYNGVIEAECRAHHYIYVDLSSIYLNPADRGPAGWPTPFGAADDFHPNALGHEMIAQRILAALTAGGGDRQSACHDAGTTSPAAPPGGPASMFYFAEGYTGSGFAECLLLFSPATGGTAAIDYYTAGGHLATSYVPLTAGRVAAVDVNSAIGAGREVSARVRLPGPGVVERVLNFDTGRWHGSTDKVGVLAPATEWDFAEGSTLPWFSEFLTLENPGGGTAYVTIQYFVERGSPITKRLVLAPFSRHTVQVSDRAEGVGGGQMGVSARVTSSAPIVAERPMYVNGYSWGSGSIRDGHDAFGANGPASTWYFAEGTTLGGFNEYLTLENPNSARAAVELRYQDQAGRLTVRDIGLAPLSRSTVAVFDSIYGVGPGLVGVSARVSSDLPIVAERPIYVARDVGAGWVEGADVALGGTQLGTGFAFSAAFTGPGEDDYLTIQSPGPVPAAVSVTYHGVVGAVVRALTVGANSRFTINLNDPDAGPGQNGRVGITVRSDQPVMVEKVTYGSAQTTYGSTDTTGSPTTVF